MDEGGWGSPLRRARGYLKLPHKALEGLWTPEQEGVANRDGGQRVPGALAHFQTPFSDGLEALGQTSPAPPFPLCCTDRLKEAISRSPRDLRIQNSSLGALELWVSGSLTCAPLLRRWTEARRGREVSGQWCVALCQAG